MLSHTCSREPTKLVKKLVKTCLRIRGTTTKPDMQIITPILPPPDNLCKPWLLLHKFILQILATLVFLLRETPQPGFSSPPPLPIISLTHLWGSNNPFQPPAVMPHLPYFALGELLRQYLEKRGNGGCR